MWLRFVWKVFIKDESVSDLCKIGNTTWKRNTLFKRSETIRKTERATIRVKCRMKLIDRKNTKELMQMLGVAVPIERMVRAAAVRWYGQV